MIISTEDFITYLFIAALYGSVLTVFVSRLYLKRVARLSAERVAAQVKAMVQTTDEIIAESRERLPELGDGVIALPDTQAADTTDNGRAVA
ncbi:MAG TPA: hypothetical protein VIQ30_22455 [Pseudonocardia sp.]